MDEATTFITIPPERLAELKERDDFFKGRPPKGDCESCGARPATSWWSGESSFTEINHGAPVYKWCELCCIEAQLEHAKKAAGRVAELEEQRARFLARLQDAEDDGA